jgi:hypothetical protein
LPLASKFAGTVNQETPVVPGTEENWVRRIVKSASVAAVVLVELTVTEIATLVVPLNDAKLWYPETIS